MLAPTYDELVEQYQEVIPLLTANEAQMLTDYWQEKDITACEFLLEFYVKQHLEKEATNVE
jgi:hypothetical protein